MSESDLPMMPFFVKDWMAATVHWACAERGAYISLLAFQWANGFVPADSAELARIAGVADADFDRVWSKIGAKFDGDEKGLFNNRLEEHRKKATRLRDAHARGATVANAVRRERRVAHVRAVNDADCSAERNAAVTPTSTSTSSSEDQSKSASLRSAHAQRVPRGTAWNEDEWINFKLEYPIRAGGVQWERAKKAWRARLADGHKWEELIEGAKRYQLYCDAAGKVGTEYVMHASTFVGPDKGFMQDWELPAFDATGATWTPPPDEAGDPV